MKFEVALFGNFTDIPELKFVTSAVAYGQLDVTLRRDTFCRVTVLVLFVSAKPEGRRSFGLNLQLCTHPQITIKSIPTNCHLSSS